MTQIPRDYAGIEFCANVERVDRDWLWRELSENAYWAKYRSRGMFDQQLDSAWRVVGAYDTVNGQMVGFARAISDSVSLAYLADVYVDRQARGRGIGTGILRLMIDGGPGRDFRWMLHTSDAHSLYAEFGFTAPDFTFMQRDLRLQHARA
ncbi:GNAT family N-acetyltransferase [Mycobacterium sp. MUNTM1]